MTISVIGAGAFGTGLSVALAMSDKHVRLWGRDADAMGAIATSRLNPRLNGVHLPMQIDVTSDIALALSADIILLAIPAQTLRPFLTDHADMLAGKSLVACCKGIDVATMTGPVHIIRTCAPDSEAAILTGPSFAADIARGLPTALTLACASDDTGAMLQETLSTQALRIYRSTDTIGAELGGALKNVIAIACGVTIGAGLGESARAALMTRGFAEMQRLAAKLGADPTTLAGLSGFGDLALTCTSEQSRNYRFGLSLGRGQDFDATTTVEGAATAAAVTALAQTLDLELPICAVVAKLVAGQTDVATALRRLLSRPLKEE